MKSKDYFGVVNKVLHKIDNVVPNISSSNKDTAHCVNNIFCKNILNTHNGIPFTNSSQSVSLVQESLV